MASAQMLEALLARVQGISHDLRAQRPVRVEEAFADVEVEGTTNG
jgi:hypothetical protein